LPSDFVAPVESGKPDYVGGFATTAGIGIEPWKEEFRKDLNDYKAIMLEALADRLSEAFAELLHLRVRKEFWGYAPDENLSHDDLLKVKLPGHSSGAGLPGLPRTFGKGKSFRICYEPKKWALNSRNILPCTPNASVSGQFFVHPESRYFSLEKVGRDQVADYARRKGKPVEFIEKFLPANLNYKSRN
jgi:5-methyltetrahydrofolate--homocysteine methyltransferase